MRIPRDALLILIGVVSDWAVRLIQDLGRWVRALARWLGEAWRVWVPVSVAMLVLIVASRLPLNLADPALR